MLSPHLQDWAKAFLNDMGVKRLKTTYNNKKLTFEIKRYIVIHIQNMNKILADL